MVDSSSTSAHLTKLIPFSTLFKNTWQIYRSRIVVFTEIMLFPVIFTIITYIITISLFSFWGSLFWTVLIAILLTISSIFLQLLAYPTLIYCTKEKLGLIDSIKLALHKFLPFFAVFLLTSLISIIGFAFLVIPGVIFIIWFSVAIYVLIYEEQKIIASLKKSRELIRGYFLPILLRLLAAYGIIAAITYMILIPISLMGRIDPSIFSESNLVFLVFHVNKFNALNFTLNNLFDIIFTPLLIVFSIQIYHDLKRIKGEK